MRPLQVLLSAATLAAVLGALLALAALRAALDRADPD